MDEAETSAAIKAAIAKTGAGSMKDMGKVVAALRADMRAGWISARRARLVKEMLPKG